MGRSDAYDQIAIASAYHAGPGGLCLAILMQKTERQIDVFAEALETIGRHWVATIELPPEALYDGIAVTRDLVIISGKETKSHFVGRLGLAEKDGERLAENFIQGKNGTTIEDGTLLRSKKPIPLKRLHWQRLCEDHASQASGDLVSLSDLGSAIEIGRAEEGYEFPEHPNAIYLARIGNRDVGERPEDVGLRPQNIVQVRIPADSVNAAFVKNALNSDFGRKQRELLKTGSNAPVLHASFIKELKVLLPTLAIQKEILDYESELSSHEATILSLRNDLEDLRRRVWTKMSVDDSARQSLEALERLLDQKSDGTSNQGLEGWIESLPFPLASILRTWQACDPAEYETRYKHLLHFFEAAAQFMSVILLSGFQRDHDFYELHREGLLKRIGGAGSSLERPCFGTWKTIRASLGKIVGKLTNFNGKKAEDIEANNQQSQKLFADPSHQLPQTVANTKFAALFDDTCKFRNEWTAHTGLVDPKLASQREQELRLYLEKFRSLCGGLWDHSLLIKPESARNRRGTHHHKVKVLRGSNTTFLTEERTFKESLDTEALYLVSGSSDEALMLLPLIRMDSSPASAKNTCYFYLRSSPQGEVTFVSYHHHQEAEFKGQYDEVGDAIRSLTEGPGNS